MEAAQLKKEIRIQQIFFSREKAESLKEKSSQQWNHAKMAATNATTVHAEEQTPE